jgi:hypothetical protein
MRKLFFVLMLLVGTRIETLAATKYAVPGGTGMACSTGSPCSLATMVTQLTPGDTGLLKNGTYSGTGTVLRLDATPITGNVVNGTAAETITLRAENPGMALILGNGAPGEVLKMINLAHWIIEDLRVENADNAAYTGSEASVLYCSPCTNVIIRKSIIRQPNTYGNNIALLIRGTNNLIEDNDVHRFHRNCVELYDSKTSNNVVRRNYCSQTLPDLSPGNDGPTDHFVAYDAPSNIWENNIAEYSGTGIKGSGFIAWARDNKYFGNIAIGLQNGMVLVASGSITTGADRYLVRHQVSINMTNYGLYLRSPINADVRSVTVHTSTTPDRGLNLNNRDSIPTTSATIRNVMLINTTGANSTAVGALVLSHSQEWGSSSSWAGGTSAVKSDSPPTPPGDVDPALGDCRVMVPDSSPFKHKGFNDEDVGANVLYVYENGELTHERLWDHHLSGPSRGKLLYGPAVIAGVNDSGTVRATVHERIGFGSSTCQFPFDYGVDRS